jgi:hypothetical protein
MPTNGSGTGIGSAPRDIRNTCSVRTMAVVFSAAIRMSGWTYSSINVDGRGGGVVSGGAAARAGLEGAQRCGRHPRMRSPGSPCACFSKQNRHRPGEFGIHGSDGAPDEKERRPEHQPPGYQASMMVQ